VYDIFGVQVLKALDYFVDEEVYELGIEAVLVPLDEIEQIVLEVLENEIHLAFLLERLLYTHHVVSLQHLEHLDLALDGPPRQLIFVAFFEFLYGHCSRA
jgi:hypothetical protein